MGKGRGGGVNPFVDISDRARQKAKSHEEGTLGKARRRAGKTHDIRRTRHDKTWYEQGQKQDKSKDIGKSKDKDKDNDKDKDKDKDNDNDKGRQGKEEERQGKAWQDRRNGANPLNRVPGYDYSRQSHLVSHSSCLLFLSCHALSLALPCITFSVRLCRRLCLSHSTSKQKRSGEERKRSLPKILKEQCPFLFYFVRLAWKGIADKSSQDEARQTRQSHRQAKRQRQTKTMQRQRQGKARRRQNKDKMKD